MIDDDNKPTVSLMESIENRRNQLEPKEEEKEGEVKRDNDRKGAKLIKREPKIET